MVVKPHFLPSTSIWEGYDRWLSFEEKSEKYSFGLQKGVEFSIKNENWSLSIILNHPIIISSIG